MTVIFDGYTAGPNAAFETPEGGVWVDEVGLVYAAASDNRPLNYARILWDMIEGTVAGDGITPELAANDYTAQRWLVGAGSWTMTTAVTEQLDTVVIAGHNLAGKTVTIFTSDSTSGAMVERAQFVPADNSAIFVMINDNGVPYSVRRYRVTVSGTNSSVGIIRAGVALQMEQPFYENHTPATKARVTEGEQSFSETGQWQGRTVKRVALSAEYSWQHLRKPWYDANFEPFAKTLPAKPFAIAGNPARLHDDVAWCWVSQDLRPVTMGIRNLVEVSMSVTGLR